MLAMLNTVSAVTGRRGDSWRTPLVPSQSRPSRVRMATEMPGVGMRARAASSTAWRIRMAAPSNGRSRSRTGSSRETCCATPAGAADGPVLGDADGSAMGTSVSATLGSGWPVATALEAGPPGGGVGVVVDAEPAAPPHAVTSAMSKPSCAVRGAGVRGRTMVHGTLDGHVPPRTGVQG